MLVIMKSKLYVLHEGDFAYRSYHDLSGLVSDLVFQNLCSPFG